MEKIKPSKRGLTFSLEETDIQVGARYRYIIDKQKQEILIIPNEQGNIKTNNKRNSV